MRRLLIACFFSLALVASAAPSASAAGPIKWFGRTLVDGSGNSDINQRSLRSVACTTPHFCVVGDNKGNAVRSNNPAGGPAAWKLQNIDGTNVIGAIGCAPALCVAADFNGNAMTLTNPANPASNWTAPSPIDPSNGIKGISCPAATLCVAVDNAGQVLTSTAPTGGPSKWTAATVDSGNFLTAVSCPSKTFCAAVDNKGNSVTSTNPTGGAPAWTLHLGIDGTTDLEGVSCFSRFLCAAIDQPGTQVGNVLTSTTPTANGAWKKRNVLGPNPDFNTLFGIACPLKSLCTAVDDAGDASTSINPTGGAAAWKRGLIDPRWGFYGVSCNSKVLCAAADSGGFVVLGKLALPGTQITKFTINKKKHTASFSFKAIGLASGFQCALRKKGAPKKAPFAKCRSPKGYTKLAAGTYTFVVRAVNASGPDPTPAFKGFSL